jgi:hypothetical protein
LRPEHASAFDSPPSPQALAQERAESIGSGKGAAAFSTLDVPAAMEQLVRGIMVGALAVAPAWP